MRVVAVLHDLVRLYSLVQDVAEVGSLWGREGREGGKVRGDKREGGRKEEETRSIVNSG